MGTVLQAVLEQNPAYPVRVFEDFSSDEVHKKMQDICDQYKVPLLRKPTWGGMQGIIQFALEESTEDWFLYIPDDVLPTPHAIEWLCAWIRHLHRYPVGLIQMPYWNYEDVMKESRNEMFKKPDLQWLSKIGFNPHWWGPALYINVNGAGFALRRRVWEQVGGWDLRTWCLDEYISYKMWTQTDYVCVSVPGPSWVHGGGMSTPAQHAFGHAHFRESTEEGWIDATGLTKQQTNDILRERMRIRGEELGWPVR